MRHAAQAAVETFLQRFFQTGVGFRKSHSSLMDRHSDPDRPPMAVWWRQKVVIERHVCHLDTPGRKVRTSGSILGAP